MTTTPADLRPALVTRWLATPQVRFVRTPLPPAPAREQLGAEQGWGAWLEQQWYATTAAAHRLVWGGAARLSTGIDVPAESADPLAARAYLADLVDRLALVYGWPADRSAALAAAMRAERPAATVYDTVERLKAFGPPLDWPSANSWFVVAGELQRVASIVSSGEAAGTVRTATITAATNIADAGRRVAAVAESNASSIGFGVGLGAVALVAGAVVVFAGPQLVAASRARRALS
jgi:hypothetical protein